MFAMITGDVKAITLLIFKTNRRVNLSRNEKLTYDILANAYMKKIVTNITSNYLDYFYLEDDTCTAT